MSKEDLKKAFGTFGDVNNELENMFGEAYTNFGDSTGNVPENLREFGALNIGPLLGRAIEHAPQLSCETNQIQILRYLNGYIQNKDFVTYNEWWSVMNHMNTCRYASCNELYDIACKDVCVSPSEMDEMFGEKIRNWKIK